jgi:hypothetical protein
MVATGADGNLYNDNILSFLPAEPICVTTVQLTQSTELHSSAVT